MSSANWPEVRELVGCGAGNQNVFPGTLVLREGGDAVSETSVMNAYRNLGHLSVPSPYMVVCLPCTVSIMSDDGRVRCTAAR
jgi:hypothetical protein